MSFPRLACVRGFSASLYFLTTAGAVWFACPPASAQLSVTAPSDGQVRQMQAWYEQHVPPRFRVHSPVLVRELTDAQMAAYLKGGDDSADSNDDAVSHSEDDDGDIDGIFESDPDRITLRLSAAGTDMFTFAHEYGHYVWFHLLSKDDRRRYEAVYKRQRAGHRLVTPYAATDLEEGFAEAFSFYVCQPLMLAWRDALSFQFLKQRSGQPRS